MSDTEEVQVANFGVNLLKIYAPPGRGPFTDIWGYTLGAQEWIMLGCYNGGAPGVSYIEVTNPAAPVERAFWTLPLDKGGNPTTLIDIKASPGNIYLLGNNVAGFKNIKIPPATPNVPADLGQQFAAGAHSFTTVNGCGALQCDPWLGRLYVAGTEIGTVVYDLGFLGATGDTPAFLGTVIPFNAVNPPRDYAIQLCAFANTLFVANTFNGAIEVYEETLGPYTATLRGRVRTPNGWAHNVWAAGFPLGPVGNVMAATDEIHGSGIAIYDLATPTAPRFIKTVSIEKRAIPHDTYVSSDGRFIHSSWYSEGYARINVTDRFNPFVDARYDTTPAGNVGGFGGAWGCHCFLPSALSANRIVLSDTNTGLHIIQVTG
jgi:hypothetical protein